MRMLVAMLGMLLCTSAACAQSADELIRKLNSSNFTEREMAARAIERLGKAALPALRSKQSTADLETHRRVQFLIEKIEERTAVEQLVEATQIRFCHSEVDVAEALREAERALRITLAAPSEKRQLARFDAGTLPYWEAWRRFRDAAVLHELDPVDSSARTLDQQSLQLTPGGRHFWAEDTRHSVRVRVRCVRLISVNGEPPQAQLAVEVRPEPRLKLEDAPHVEITGIVGADGKEAAVRDRPDAMDTRAGHLQIRTIQWTGPGRTIKELHGRLHMKATVNVLFSIPNVLQAIGSEVRCQGIGMKVLDVEREDENIAIHVRLSGLQNLYVPATMMTRSGAFHQPEAISVALERLRLVGMRGEVYPQVKYRYERHDLKQDYDVQLLYAAKTVGKEMPALMLARAPHVVEFDIPFLVRDIVLPK